MLLKSLAFLLLSFLACGDPIEPSPRRLITKSLVLSNGLSWGDWGTVEYCADGSFATDFEVKFEDYGFLDADETALNAIKLYCSLPDGVLTGYITSTEGTKGEWKGLRACPNGYMTGLRARILDSQGLIGDDVAVQNVEMECNYGESTVIGMDAVQLPRIPDGTWSNWAKCDNGSAICGLEMRYEKVNLLADDAATADISMFCCAIEAPLVKKQDNEEN